MSLKRNILANYFGQLYVTLVGIVMLPVYFKYIGAEAYGLVGFFTVLQASFQLLDMGLTPTMARQTARYQGGALDAQGLRRLLRALEGIFVGVALLGGLSIIGAAEIIATRWLNVETLPLSEVHNAVMLMGITVALRWTSSLYRGAINGFEKLVWLSGWNSLVATLRFVVVIPFFVIVGTSPTQFFSYQLGVSLLELGVLVTQTYRLLPKVERDQRTPWQWEPLRGVLKFSLSIAFTSSVWVLVTQTDKLVLSKLLPLADYGYFALAVLVASGVMMVSGPISGAIMPRMTRLHASGDEAGLIQLYRNATQLVAVIAMPAALVLAFYSEHVLWAWTGDAMLATKAAPVLTLYAIGNGILVVAAFQYYLQFAKGDMKLHLIGNAFFVSALIPSLILATWQFGMVGAGWVWLISNGAALLLWVPVVHRRFAKGLHWPWLARDVGLITLIAVIATKISSWIISWSENRVTVVLQLAAVSMLTLAVSSLGSSWLREWALQRWFGYPTAYGVERGNNKP